MRVKLTNFGRVGTEKVSTSFAANQLENPEFAFTVICRPEFFRKSGKKRIILMDYFGAQCVRY